MGANIKPVTGRKAPWPPRDFEFFHYVGTPGMNWWSLAWAVGRDNPWDLIVFNFETEDPGEVNYYLKEYVGCTSLYGSDFTFENANPGLIYVPKSSWRPPARYRKARARKLSARALANRVATILRRAAKVCPWVGGFGYTITPADLGVIAAYVESGRVKCAIEPSIAFRGAIAEYWPNFGFNEMQLAREPSSVSMDDVVSIVHESVHAVFDFHEEKKLYRSTNEMLAHAVSSIVAARLFPHQVENRLKAGPSLEIEYGLLFFGWAIMRRRESQMMVSLDRLAGNRTSDVEDPFQGFKVNLYSALSQFVSKRYRHVWKQVDSMDGIP